MTTRRKLATALGLTTAALGAGLASAAPASAGGIVVIASPSFDNSCANHGTTGHGKGATKYDSGTATGLLAALPVETPLNQCGGADLPLGNDEGFFPEESERIHKHDHSEDDRFHLEE